MSRLALSWAGAFNAEWTKLRSVRSTYILLAIAVGLVLTGFLLEAIDGDRTLDAAIGVGLRSGVGQGQLAIAVLGALAVTGEYASGMIRATLAAVPTRLPVLTAKAAALALAIVVVSIVTFIAGSLAAAMIVGGDLGAVLSDPEVIRAFLGGAGYLVGIALIGSAIGWLTRSAAFAVTLIAIVTIVLPITLPLIQLDWVERLGEFLPNEIGRRMVMLGERAAIETGLGPLASSAVYAAYAAIALAAAALVLRRRDA